MTNALGSGVGISDIDCTTETDYDKLGRVTKVVQPSLDGTQATRPVTTTTYDADGNVQTVTDPRGFVTTYYYDESNRKIVEEDAVGDYTWYYYDNDGNLVDVVNANGATSASPPAEVSGSTVADDTTRYFYDALGRKIEECGPVSGGGAGCVTTQYAFDASGNMTSTTDPNGNTTSYVYNLEGQQTETIDALGDVTTTVYDAVGNVLSTTNALGATTFFQYDPTNRKIASISPLPYSGEGQASNSPLPLAGEGQGVRVLSVPGEGQIVVAGGPITTWAYDHDGNVTSITDPLGNTTWTQYNACNLPIAVTDALGWEEGDPQHTTTTAYTELRRGVHGDRSLGADAPSTFTTTSAARSKRSIRTQAPARQVRATRVARRPTTVTMPTEILLHVEDPLGIAPSNPSNVSTFDPTHTTWYFYDGLNRQTCVVDALNTTTYLFRRDAHDAARQ